MNGRHLHAQAVCWKNGKIVTARDATVSIFDHGFLYGDGVFEGIRFYHGRPFRLQEHLKRLTDSAHAIALDMPYSPPELSEAITRCIHEFNDTSGYIRLIVTRGEGCLGINPDYCASPTTIIIIDHLEMTDAATKRNGARLIIAATRKLAPDGLDPRIKSLNYLNHILARIEANQVGADEAVLLNTHGHVAEGTADNIFTIKDESIRTPPTSDGALGGITRAVVFELACKAGMDIREQSLTAYDLYTADGCFLTGTGAELIPVAEINGRRLPEVPHRLFKRLNQAFHARIEQECR